MRNKIGKRSGETSTETMDKVRVIYRRVGKADAMILLMEYPLYELTNICSSHFIPFYSGESKSKVVSRIYARVEYLESKVC